jgi:hypothetical protein
MQRNEEVIANLMHDNIRSQYDDENAVCNLT